MTKVLFFAHLRDTVGKEAIDFDADGKTVAELKQEVTKIYQLPNMDAVITAINEEFASDKAIIKAGDVVAFIPPVSGG